MKDKILGWVLLVLAILAPYGALALFASFERVSISNAGEFSVEMAVAIVAIISVGFWMMTWIVPQYLVWVAVKDIPFPVRRAASFYMTNTSVKGYLLNWVYLSSFFAIPGMMIFLKDYKRLPKVLDLLYGAREGLDGTEPFFGFKPGSYGHRVLFGLYHSGDNLAYKFGSTTKTADRVVQYGSKATMTAQMTRAFKKESSGNYMLSAGNHFQVGSVTNLFAGWQLTHEIGVRISQNSNIARDDYSVSKDVELPVVSRSIWPAML